MVNMAKVTVLMEGYLAAEMHGHTSSTITLVQDKGLNMIVDPGTVTEQKIICEMLKREGLHIDDINAVFITHAHMDHYRNIGMFPKAKAIDYWGIWEKDVWKKNGARLTDNIRVVRTPGHSYDSVSLLVRTKEGIVAVCGDVFWKKNHPRKDPYANDTKKLRDSRKVVIESADFVVPGHGKMFSTKE